MESNVAYAKEAELKQMINSFDIELSSYETILSEISSAVIRIKEYRTPSPTEGKQEEGSDGSIIDELRLRIIKFNRINSFAIEIKDALNRYV